jgi:RimJ/RimL family protein N-acetyltransferase
MKESDIDSIVDYWLGSPDDYMRGMGVDLELLPDRNEFGQMLINQLNLPLEEKQSFALIMVKNGKAIGHTNVNPFEFGKEGYMHLHIWNVTDRRQGVGRVLLPIALKVYFEDLQLKKLWCQPYAENHSPEKILRSIGFQWVKRFRTKPGSICFDQEVNLWGLDREDWLKAN